VVSADIAKELEQLFHSYIAGRLLNERLGDWADRVGVENIQALTGAETSVETGIETIAQAA
jgi:hypothetical protein